jgi:hypothetical protein
VKPLFFRLRDCQPGRLPTAADCEWMRFMRTVYRVLYHGQRSYRIPPRTDPTEPRPAHLAFSYLDMAKEIARRRSGALRNNRRVLSCTPDGSPFRGGRR